jgi:hypothetical protein
VTTLHLVVPIVVRSGGLNGTVIPGSMLSHRPGMTGSSKHSEDRQHQHHLRQEADGEGQRAEHRQA